MLSFETLGTAFVVLGSLSVAHNLWSASSWLTSTQAVEDKLELSGWGQLYLAVHLAKLRWHRWAAGFSLSAAIGAFGAAVVGFGLRSSTVWLMVLGSAFCIIGLIGMLVCGIASACCKNDWQTALRDLDKAQALLEDRPADAAEAGLTPAMVSTPSIALLAL